MSRFSEYDGDEDYNNQGEFWMKRAQLALEGKRGRKALADLREALLALPEKRLISRALCTVGGEQRVEATVRRTDGRLLPRSTSLAWELASQNDDTYELLTPERRYKEFLDWIDQQLAKPPLRRPAPKERRVKNRAAAAATTRVASNVAAGQIELGL